MFNITLKYGITRIVPVEGGYEAIVVKTFYCSQCGAEYDRIIARKFMTKEQYEKLAKKCKNEDNIEL